MSRKVEDTKSRTTRLRLKCVPPAPLLYDNAPDKPWSRHPPASPLYPLARLPDSDSVPERHLAAAHQSW